MENLFFFQKATSNLLELAGCNCEEYEFSFIRNGTSQVLHQSGVDVTRLSDSSETWKVENDGITLNRDVVINYPYFLKGKDGIACKKAELGMCIIWKNRKLSQKGYILPYKISSSEYTEIYSFRHTFLPGELSGDLVLDTVFYIKSSAEAVDSTEINLMNEEGVIVGEVDTKLIDFSNIYMDFPIFETSDKNQPLWWMEVVQWDDPTVDKFTDENIKVYINTSYAECPKIGDSIKNTEILSHIIATSYFILFSKLSDDELNRTRKDIDLEPNSICKILYYFIDLCVDNNNPLVFDNPERLLKTITFNVKRILAREY